MTICSPTPRDVVSEIRKAAIEWEALRAQAEAALPQRESSDEGYRVWREACATWHNYRSILNTFWRVEALKSLEAGDRELLEIAIGFVEVDPYYFRSGYLKKRLFRRLRRIRLSDDHRRRVLKGILKALPTHRGDGWKDFCLLAAAFSDVEFAQSAARFFADPDPQVVRRAKILQNHIQSRREFHV